MDYQGKMVTIKRYGLENAHLRRMPRNVFAEFKWQNLLLIKNE